MTTGQRSQQRTIRREEAEQLIVRYQKELLEDTHYRIPCELYAQEGGGPCEGLNRFNDIELIELYRREVPGIESLRGDALLDRVIDYESSQLHPDETTCALMVRLGRLCDGLARFTNEDLSQAFAEALGGRRVVD
jgi:hypothetical protein